MKGIAEYRVRLLVTTGSLALGFVLATNAAQAGQSGAKKAGAPAAATSQRQPSDRVPVTGLAGQRVHIDPQSGKLREPEHEESKQLSDQMRRLAGPSVKQLKAVRHPNGMLTVDTQGAFLSYSVAKVNADGTVSQECVKSLDEAKAWMKTTPQTPQKEAADVE